MGRQSDEQGKMNMKTFKRSECGIVQLDNNEVATAIRAYLVAHDVYAGPVTTVTWEVDGKRADCGSVECAVVVYPSSRLVVGGELVSGPGGTHESDPLVRSDNQNARSINNLTKLCGGSGGGGAGRGGR